MQKNDIFTITIDGMTDDGSGVGRVDGLAVFVPYTLVGETVSVKILKTQKRYAFGKAMDILEPSAMRIEPECPHFYRCGGCQFFHCTYEEELKYKEQQVRDALARIGNIAAPVQPIVGAPDTFHYRNKAQFPVSESGIGFYSQRSHNIVDIDSCIIQNTACDAIVRCVRDWMKRYDIAPYNESRHSGSIRHIYTRTAAGTGEVMVCIVTRDTDIKYPELLVESLLELDSNIVGVVQNINPKPTNIILGGKNRILRGRDYIFDTIGDLTYKISMYSFFQVNSMQTKVLYDTARDALNLTGGETVWDLYSGIGTIGLYMARSAGKVIGVEIVPDAVRDARENAKLNDIDNAVFYEGSAEGIAPILLKDGYTPDVIIVDPPRKGCDADLLSTIAKASPKKLLYISCKPSTLARDLAALSDMGYTAQYVQPVDMFPRTGHVETMVLLEHRFD